MQLLYHNQPLSLPILSWFKTIIALVTTFITLQRLKLKVSTHFIDIKVGVDNVDATILSSTLHRAGVLQYMVSWIISFLLQ